MTQLSVRGVCNTLLKILPVKSVSKQTVTFGSYYLQDDEIMLLFWDFSDDYTRISKNRFSTLL
jgi:hypothetical protein